MDYQPDIRLTIPGISGWKGTLANGTKIILTKLDNNLIRQLELNS